MRGNEVFSDVFWRIGNGSWEEKGFSTKEKRWLELSFIIGNNWSLVC